MKHEGGAKADDASHHTAAPPSFVYQTLTSTANHRLKFALKNPLIAGSLAEKPLSSIQAAESPERNLFPRREFDVVNSERGTGEVFTAYLRPVLSLSAHFDDGLLVYPEFTVKMQ